VSQNAAELPEWLRTRTLMERFMHTLINSKPRLALVLGVGGLLPFFACLALIAYATPTLAATAQLMLASYAAIILSFLGGILWGGQIERTQYQPQVLALSVVPALVAWSAAMLGAGWPAMLLLAAAFAATYWIDRLSGWPRWFARLRLGLTLTVVSCLICAAVLVMRT
jgi:hypothetical protein